MKNSVTIMVYSCLVIIAELCTHPVEAQEIKDQTQRIAVAAHAGTFVSPGEKCRAELKRSEMGGFLVLEFDGKDSLSIDDVNGIAWLSADRLIYTASPIYGRSGLYTYDCGSKEIKTLVAPKTFDKAYPHGADYFELHRVYKGDPITVYYYYAPDVDMMDAAKLRTPAHISQLRLSAKQLEDGQR